jgi:Fe-Mn family superoxide dismutase
MFKLPELEYDYDALAPAISGRIMRLHHDKHHATYVEKLNAAVASEPSLDGVELLDMLRDLSAVPESVRTAVRNHGGGHFNHSRFWRWMTPHGAGEPTGELKTNLLNKYDSFQKFVDEFSTAAAGVFGSGWVWLLPDLSIAATPNQDVPLDQGEPLLGLDVWEHAYYLDYNAARADYIKAWWDIVNWDEVAEYYRKGAK